MAKQKCAEKIKLAYLDTFHVIFEFHSATSVTDATFRFPQLSIKP